ncbi:hypothetical protein F2P79_022559 [Pimephales promelas]|nr:hypothetical protein F2P79_022559 [Pimephales promelas]
MPPSYHDSFVEYCFSHGILQTGTDRTYTLSDFSAWLQLKSQAKRISNRAAALYQGEVTRIIKKDPRTPYRPKDRSTSILYSTNSTSSVQGQAGIKTPKANTEVDNGWKALLEMWKDTYFRQLHSEAGCKTCKVLHLTILHEVALQTQKSVLLVNVPNSQVYLDRPNRSPKVMLKVVKVLLHNGDKAMETYAVLDDGSERSIVLPQAVEQLNLTTVPETLKLRTIRQDVHQLNGASVSLSVSPLNRPTKMFQINHAFTAANLRLSEHSYPIAALQHKYAHIWSLPLPQIERAQPLLLIGSDMPHLLVPVQPIRMGPPNAPIAVHTRLGWTLQGPVGYSQTASCDQQCLNISIDVQNAELLKNVERLWQIDTLPYIYETAATRSKQDQHALTEAVLASLRSTERRLAKDPNLSEAYCTEMNKLEQAGYVAEISNQEAEKSTESWYIPHHMGQSLNELLIPGPTLGPSLLGVLLRFRQHTVAVSGDVKGYKPRQVECLKPTLRNIYKVLASQYDPLGYLIPFTTQAKILVQDLWKIHVGWDDLIESDSLRNRWQTWLQELHDLDQQEIPRCYTPFQVHDETFTRDLHIFCDASERAFGSVSYMRTEDKDGHVHISFVLARSRVAPRKQMSMPRLELSAALTGAQVAKVLTTELTVPIRQVVLWSDSTTVLHWLLADSCRYKVFVGTRVAEIQSLTDVNSWRYVDSGNNPADDITRCKKK